MKISQIVALGGCLLATGCAGGTSAEVAASGEAAIVTTTGSHVYRGSVDLEGQRYGIEVTLLPALVGKQRKYCARYEDQPGSTLYAGISVSPDWDADAGTIRTVIRSPEGEIVAETSRHFNPLTVYAAVDAAVQCTEDAQIADRNVHTAFVFENSLQWIPGVAADVPNGPIWVNPSYGGPAQVALTLSGTATFHSASSTATLAPRPGGGVGQELHFTDRAPLTLEPMREIEIEVGTGLREGIVSAKVVTVTLTRQ